MESNADIAGPTLCNKLNSNKCRLLVNKANLVHNLFLVYGRPVISTQNNKYQVSHKHTCFSWWAHSCLKHVEIDKFTKSKLCTKLALFITLYKDAQSTKHKEVSPYHKQAN